MLDIFIKGGPVMYPLLICSVISLTVIIERAFFWIGMGMRRNQKLVDEVLELCRQGDWESVRKKQPAQQIMLFASLSPVFCIGNIPCLKPWNQLLQRRSEKCVAIWVYLIP